MFTGLVEAQGRLLSSERGRFRIAAPWQKDTVALGASICCDGCCLTAVEMEEAPGGMVFSVDVSGETLSRTTLGDWQPGHLVNLERSLKAGDEMGGHIVTGHVDGIARIDTITPAGSSRIFRLTAPENLARYIAPKGSVALDGTSLTVNEVEGNSFTINLI